MIRLMPALLGFALPLSWAVVHVAAQGTDMASLTVKESGRYSAYLADRQGRALYLFTADKQGKGDAPASSDCTDACADAWPPLTVDGEPQAAAPADASLLGTIERKNGQEQVTYNGWPLYYFSKDVGPDDVTGHDVEEFGGEWYLVTPAGETVEEH